jgi:hypothetical protein
MLAICGASESCVWAIVTGDLTGSGKEGQFVVGHTFLHSAWQIYRCRRSRMGLELSREQCLSVPGNHDHWRAGNRRYNPRIYGKHFEPTPWRKALTSPENRLQLDLFGVDSCSGPVDGIANLFASGAISDEQFAGLESHLKHSQREERTDAHHVRAVVCHHSLTRHSASSWTRALESSSAWRLLRLAGQYNVCALLTGHAHSAKSEPYQLGPRSVWELRSPTTLQAEPQAGYQGFWMHRILLCNRRPEWHAILFTWDGAAFCPWPPQVLD